MTRSEAVEAIKTAIPRCLGEKIHLSAITAAALGLKGKSITKAEAKKLVDAESPDSGEDDAEPESDADATPAKPKRRGKEKPAEPPAESGPVVDPLG